MPNDITGYRKLSDEETKAINDIKSLEAAFNGMIDYLRRFASADGRLIALAQTEGEKAFMFAVKAVAAPERQVIRLPEFNSDHAA